MGAGRSCSADPQQSADRPVEHSFLAYDSLLVVIIELRSL